MTTWFRDSTRRFNQRPFYTHADIEGMALELARSIEGEDVWPLSDDALSHLVEARVAEFDAYADLRHLGVDVDGYTLFRRNGLPAVLINADLADDRNRFRRRMTIAHELGHVVLHQPLYERDQRQLEMLVEQERVPALCEATQILRGTDWCEWQASFFAGALLMPSGLVRSGLFERMPELQKGVEDRSNSAQRAASIVSKHFEVSPEAARVRLAQLCIINPAGQQRLDVESA
jgi:Zn-dependent peptidase ImmA (M78 family)